MAKKKKKRGMSIAEVRRKNGDALVQVITNIPVIPLRDLVICPEMVAPVMVGRPASVQALEEALMDEKMVFLVAQRSFEVDEPKRDDLFDVGCIARILQTVRTPDGSAKALIEGVVRARLISLRDAGRMLTATVQRIDYEDIGDNEDFEALTRATMSLFEQYADANPKLPTDIHLSFRDVAEPAQLLHLLTGHLTIKPEEKVELLGHTDMHLAYFELCRVMSREIDLLRIEHKIHGEVRRQIDDQQKSYYLNEQIKAIERELGKKGYSEVKEYEHKIGKAKMPAPVEKVAKTELEKLSRMPPFSPEGAVIRNYLDWLIAIPWRKATKDNLDLEHARDVLESTHYGLKEPKERVLEHLAVRKLRAENKGKLKRADGKPLHAGADFSTVLCLVGPPGVGKTSLGRSVADSLGRKFVRISLGGVRDEAEIRGHRRTYVGALPGRIIQGLKKAGTKNPVILLDEVDKMFADFRGDPAAALLEVLDPEQNHAFNDHYLEVDVDLSDVMFICTANVEDTIHPTLRDRMEKIELSSYTEAEKEAIAEKFLVEKQKLLAGIAQPVAVSGKNLTTVIRDYTREAGVRQLERSIAQIMRKIAVRLVAKKKRGALRVTGKQVREYLGTPKHRLDMELPEAMPGVALGLAWTETGGDILKVEATVLDGKGELILTGQLGDVMQESARAAVTYVRKHRKEVGLSATFFAKHDLHIHVPEGAIPKDGPSAGITIATALYSALGEKVVRARLAMTGEITLGGAVLAIGGLKEKLLAAHRVGVTDVIMPKRSVPELDDVPDEVKKALRIHAVKNMDDVVRIAFNEKMMMRS